MDRSNSLRVAAFAGLMASLASVAGCVDDGGSLHVVCSISPDVADDGCTFNPESDTCVFKGVMNLAAAKQYDAALGVESGLKPRASNVPPRPEPNRLSLTGATIEIRKPNGARLDIPGLDNPFPFAGSGTVPPGGHGVMSVTLIPSNYADRLRENVLGGQPETQVVVAVKVKGVTDGGEEVESGEWLWPINLEYTSPVQGEGCTVMDYCQSLGGLDAFANACQCTAPDTSCKL
ncbi:MAG: hypothetical protein QM778_07505 [Myxococcales bacterium]